MADLIDIIIAKLTIEFGTVFVGRRRFSITRSSDCVRASVFARRGDITVRTYEDQFFVGPNLEEEMRESLRQADEFLALFRFDERIERLIETDDLVHAIVTDGIARKLPVSEIMTLLVEAQWKDRVDLRRAFVRHMERVSPHMVVFKDGVVDETST